MRRAGLQFDRSQIQTLTGIVQEKPTPSRFLMETTLHSLARMGATDALPAVDALIQGGGGTGGNDAVDPNVVNAARAARARSVAEAAYPDAGAAGQMQAKLARFYAELGETPASLNAAMLAYMNGPAKNVGPGISPKYPVELYALRELADMAYSSPQRNFTSALPGMVDVDFALDATGHSSSYV